SPSSAPSRGRGPASCCASSPRRKRQARCARARMRSRRRGRGGSSMAAPELLFDGLAEAPLTVALAHGAGAPMDSGFMNVVARGLAARGLRVVRFEFPYMARRRESGKRGAPDRTPVLEQTWLDVIAELGGKEGGR